MSVRRQSRSRSRRGRRRHSRPKTDRSRPRKERKRKREESSRGRDGRDGREADRAKRRLSRKSVSSKPIDSKPKEPSVASDVASEIASEDENAMNSEEEQAWLEKRRLLRIEIQKKHQASCRSPSTKSTPSNPPPSTGQLRTTSAEESLPTNPSGIAPGTPFQFEPGADGDVADIFGLVSTEPERSPQPESPVTAQPSCGSSNEGDRRDEESLEKIDASEVLKKLGADESETEDYKNMVGGIDVRRMRKDLAKERGKIREFIRKTKNDFEEAEEKGEEARAQAIAEFQPDLREDWDDQEGYYKPSIGELIDGRYKVFDECAGKGVFSNVIKATDVSTGAKVAIKIIRSNDMMKKAADKEVGILRALNKADTENKRRSIVRLLEVFMYRNHFCMVFELMAYNLRQALKNYGKGRGLTLSAVHGYACQLFIALRLIKKCGYVHADIKPDNLLIGSAEGKELKRLKICDLGSALDANTECDITPYLVSRFYRAPEIILGQKYDYQVDVWSVGCTLYELLTGKILFKGATNNDLLKHIIDVCGITNKMKRGETQKKHFSSEGHFLWEDKDKFSKKTVVRTIKDFRPKIDISKEIIKRCRPEHRAKAKQLSDLIKRATTIDPKKRITPDEAFEHPFLKFPVPDSKS